MIAASEDPVAASFRRHWGRVLAALVRFCGDVGVAEDATADAFERASARWPLDGVPGHPLAWLITTARRCALDRLRRERVLAEKTRLLAAAPGSEADMSSSTDEAIPDDRLALIFLCCHPALATEARVALTLRTLGGLTPPEIARAFLVSEETMKRRLGRAKAKIATSGVPFARPGSADLPGRLSVVLAVLYLIFNQGYGDGRRDLAAEAIRLTRLLAELMGERTEPASLLALMLLHDSRRAARVRAGVIVPLEQQDRGLWDAGRIAEGRALLRRALARGARDEYAVQAAIAECHTVDPVDWRTVDGLHRRLYRMTGSPVVELNRAVAVAHLDGPRTALALLSGLAGELEHYRYYHATRAELLRRLGDTAAARVAFARALDLATTDAERRFLRAGLDDVEQPG